MAAFEQEIFNEDDDGYITESGGSDPAYDSDLDPSYSILEDAHANFSKLSIGKKSKSRIGKDLAVGVDENEEKVIENIIGAGQLEKLKVEQYKVYLRKNGLRLTGNKQTLIDRIKEHLEISNVGGEKKYPVSSFVLGCKGDACTGDVVMFEQNVYEMFNIAARSAGGPPCGKRIVAGRIVKESYGAAKQQHTFTASQKPYIIYTMGVCWKAINYRKSFDYSVIWALCISIVVFFIFWSCDLFKRIRSTEFLKQS